MSLGHGTYLKLINDYVEFEEGAILNIVEIIKTHIDNKEILFFANGVSYLKAKDFYYSKDINEFLPVCSFWSTWIGAIGLWKDDFEKISSYYTFKTTNFYHTELLFESFRLNKGAVTYTRRIFISNEVVNKTMSFNFFDLFINSYLNTLIKGLLNDKRITYRTYLHEKNKFFYDFLYVWYKKIRIKNNHTIKFDTRGMEKLLFKNYKTNPIFYLYLLYLPFYLTAFYIKKAFR